MIHVASAEAVQLHSGCAVTEIAPFPPEDTIESEGASSDTWHFTGDGPVDVLDLDSHPIDAIARPRKSDGPSFEKEITVGPRGTGLSRSAVRSCPERLTSCNVRATRGAGLALNRFGFWIHSVLTIEENVALVTGGSAVFER